jgi:protein ATS1
VAWQRFLGIQIKTLPSGKVELWAWGWNEHGNLALGHCDDVRTPTHIPVPQTEGVAPMMERSTITGIWAGCGTSWVATEVLINHFTTV